MRLLPEGSARVNFPEVPRFSRFARVRLHALPLLLRVPDGELHPADQGRPQHGDQRPEVVQPACGAREHPEAQQRGSRGGALLQARQVGQVLLRLHGLQRPGGGAAAGQEDGAHAQVLLEASTLLPHILSHTFMFQAANVEAWVEPGRSRRSSASV